MSKWRKPLKNKKRFDARYFMDERDENALNEILDQKVRLKRKREAEDLMAHMSYERSKQAHNFSFDSWLNEAEQSSNSEEITEEIEEEIVSEEVVDESHCGSNKRDDEEEELEEGAKPDFLDLDKDGDKEEPMKKAAKEAEEAVKEG